MVSWEEQPLPRSFDSVFYGAAGTDAGGASDDEFNRTSFLSHFDGTNNGVNSAFDDASDSNHTITANGNVTQGSFNPYGTNWAVDFSRDTNPRLSCGSSSDFTFGTGDFTVEFFVFFYSLTSYQTPMSAGYSNDSGGMFIQTGNGDGKFQFRSGGSALVSETTSDAVANKWYHIAFSRQSGTLRVYRNGVQTGTASNSTNLNRTGNILIGSDNDYNIDGLLSNFRLVKGTSLYNSNFTAPTSPLTAVTNTTLLTLQSNRFIDNSASGHTVSPNTGKEAVTSFGPFLTSSVYDPAVNGASGSFASGNYLTASADADFTIGTGNFTVEFWIYPTDFSEPYMPVVIIGDNSGGLLIGKSEADGTGFGAYPKGIAGNIIRTNTLPQLNAWTHVLYSRSGTSVKMFYNGVEAASSTSSYDFQAGALTVGSYSAYSRYWTGNITDLRYVKGTATVTSNFTPPTAPLSAITNTKLLLNMADGQAIDSAAQNNLTLFGNAKLSTGQAKFGDTSMVFDGTGDYVTLPSDSFTPFGTGDFTIECFARFDAISGQGVFQLGASYLPSAVTGPAVFGTSDGGSARWRMYYATSYADNTSNPPSTNTWFHIAFVRASGVSKVYIDGVEVLSENDTTNYTNKFFVIGGAYSSSFLMDGYIDDFRISHFARYTSNNFTPPSAAFADKGQ